MPEFGLKFRLGLHKKNLTFSVMEALFVVSSSPKLQLLFLSDFVGDTNSSN